MSKQANSLRKRPNINFLNPQDLGERGRDLAVAVRRLKELDQQQTALTAKYRKLRSDLLAEKDFLARHIDKLTNELTYLMEVEDITYEEEVQKVLDSIVEVQELEGGEIVELGPPAKQ